MLWHIHFNSRFDSLLVSRVKLIKEFHDCVPSTVTFNVGYFEGQQHSKISMITAKDLSTMYSRNPKGEISTQVTLVGKDEHLTYTTIMKPHLMHRLSREVHQKSVVNKVVCQMPLVEPQLHLQVLLLTEKTSSSSKHVHSISPTKAVNLRILSS